MQVISWRMLHMQFFIVPGALVCHRSALSRSGAVLLLHVAVLSGCYQVLSTPGVTVPSKPADCGTLMSFPVNLTSYLMSSGEFKQCCA